MTLTYPASRLAAFAAVAASFGSSAYAQTTTWTGATNNLWSEPGNWSDGVPQAGDGALFGASAPTNVLVDASFTLQSIDFLIGGAYTTNIGPADVTLEITGFGTANVSGQDQSFVVHGGTTPGTGIFTPSGGKFDFSGSAVANGINVTNHPGQARDTSGFNGGYTRFYDTASAGNGTFTSIGGDANEGGGGRTMFFNSASAGTATLVSAPASASIQTSPTSRTAFAGLTLFADSSTADQATILIGGATAAGGSSGR